MIFQVDFNMESFATPILDVGVLVGFTILMIYLYSKFRVFPLILLVVLTSMIIGIISIQLSYNPFTPYIQVFFITFQTIIFLITAFDFFEKRKEVRK